jgi:hypothetical protein
MTYNHYGLDEYEQKPLKPKKQINIYLIKLINKPQVENNFIL